MENFTLINMKDLSNDIFFIYSMKFNEYMTKKLDQLCRKDNSVKIK
ncbi:hypothetical protein MACJ_003907 [Theileria orientalis]|uniref:Uncharacterized protein n=1 Tax=Theileria orientalis TaxID=68886 RepID=A0A976XJE4_THEOR|nr:hypothetical protein MACJ_003907 [Theileria orientalis]